MSVLFVLAGTSAIENREVGQAPDGRDNKALLASVRSYQKDACKKPEQWTELFHDLVTAHLAYWGQPEPYIANPDNYKQTAAELISTHCLYQQVLRPPPERLVLLSSTTEDGKFAAKIVQTVMQSTQYGIPVEKDKVILEIVDGLDQKLEKAAEGLIGILNRYRPDPRETVYFNATGGYKGTAVLAGMLAIKRGFDVFYQHETSKTPYRLDKELRIQALGGSH